MPGMVPSQEAPPCLADAWQTLIDTQTSGAAALDAAAAALASLAPSALAHAAHPAVARLLTACPSPQLADYVAAGRRWTKPSDARAADAISGATTACAAGAAAAVAAEAAAARLLDVVRRRTEGRDDDDDDALAAVAAVAAVADAAAAAVEVRRRVAAWVSPAADAGAVTGTALAWRLTPAVAGEDVERALRVEREVEGT